MARHRSDYPKSLKRKPKKPAKPYEVFNNINPQHTLQPEPCAYCFYCKKANCYILRRKNACERCAHRKQPCNFPGSSVAPKCDPSPGEDPKEHDSSDKSEASSIGGDSPAKNLRPCVTSTSKRARVPDSESEGDGGKGGSSSAAPPALHRANAGLIQARSETNNSAILHLVTELIKADGYISEKVEQRVGERVEEKEVSFKVERRSLLAKVDELESGNAEKCQVVVVEAGERAGAAKDREWRARQSTEIGERKVFGSKFIEDFETAFVTRSFLETPRAKGKGKAKILEVDREEGDGTEKDQLEDDFPNKLFDRS
ncbi:hypothetical protein P7C70_g7082, partial [Phenoliferia sp. Uapishka_3]